MSIKDKYYVDPIDSRETYDWLLNKHYAKRVPSIVFSFGLYEEELGYKTLIGVCTYGLSPSSTLASSIAGDKYKDKVLELNRLCVNDGLPKNALSYFVSQSLSIIKGYNIIVSFSDINMKHHGYIYQACNFIYTGTSSNTAQLIDKEGNEFHFRNIGHYQKKLKGKINILKRISDNLSDDLLKKEYKNIPDKNKFTGHCYVASECYYHLCPDKLDVYHIKHENSTHWFLKDNDKIIDVTREQFKTPVPYNNAVKGFFLTKKPSKRARILINRVIQDSFKIIKRRLNEDTLDRIVVANYLRKNKGSYTAKQIDKIFGYKDTAAHWFRLDKGFSYPSVDDWVELKEILNLDDTLDQDMLNYDWIPCANDIIKQLELQKIEILPKHRYIYIIGNKRKKADILKHFKYEKIPYPKGDNKKYDASYKPITQMKLF
tara:strand:+ start:83 stop:1372 length:1290 start_codon:yes stop_codon:yes gene_type:complete